MIKLVEVIVVKVSQSMAGIYISIHFMRRYHPVETHRENRFEVIRIIFPESLEPQANLAKVRNLKEAIGKNRDPNMGSQTNLI